MSPQELLGTSPFDEPLEEALAAHPPRAKLPVATLCLGAGVVAVAGFIGGVHADRRWGSSATGATAPLQTRSANRQGFPGMSGQPGTSGQSGFPGGGFPGTGGITAGTVVRVSGGVAEVKTADGKIVKVAISEQTRVTTVKEGSVKDLAPGVSVTVRGNDITVRPAG